MNTEIVGWKKGLQHRFDRYGQQRSWVREDPPAAEESPEPKQLTIDDVPMDTWEDATKVKENPFLEPEEKVS